MQVCTFASHAIQQVDLVNVDDQSNDQLFALCSTEKYWMPVSPCPLLIVVDVSRRFRQERLNVQMTILVV